MCPKYPLLLIFGIILSLAHLSSSQNWAAFRDKHISSTADIDCDTIMQKPIYTPDGRCKAKNTFIITTQPNNIKALCSKAADKSLVTSKENYQLIDCDRISGVTPPCPYNRNIYKNAQYICIKCDKKVPVHFEKIGRC